jgi:hypothetical protein
MKVNVANIDQLFRSAAGRNPENQKLIQEAQASLRKHASSHTMAGLQDPERKPHPVPALDPRAEVHPTSKRGVVVVVTIIRCALTEIDSDNFSFGAKPVRDSVSKALGCDDRDRRIKWEYRQCVGEGPEGTIVKINTID